MRRVVAIAGVPVALEADAPYQVDAVEALFGGCPQGRTPAAVTVRYQSEPPAVPERDPDFVYPEAVVWLEESGVAARHESGTCGRRIGDTVIVGGPPPAGEPVRGFRQAVQHALLDALARHDRHALHAAGLHREPVTLLVLGGSGAGKSTLAYAGAQAGWQVLSDDLCLIHPTTAIEVSGFPKPLNVPGDALATPPDGARPIPDDDRSRWALPHSFVTAHDVYPLNALVLVGHSPAEAGTNTVDEGPARLEVVLGSMPLRGLPTYVRRFFPIAGRISRLPAVWYLHAGDPALRQAAATAFLDEQWDQWERLGHGAQ